jgi:hypothetical protein
MMDFPVANACSLLVEFRGYPTSEIYDDRHAEPTLIADKLSCLRGKDRIEFDEWRRGQRDGV